MELYADYYHTVHIKSYKDKPSKLGNNEEFNL